MLLSVDNFKSIKHVVEVDVSGLTVLAGVNSSGKSSLIQALLLLKQTLNSSSSEMLNLNGPYVYANSLMDLMHNKKAGDMKFVIKFNNDELFDAETVTYLSYEKYIETVEVSVSFRVRADSYVLSEFQLRIEHKGGELDGFLLQRMQRKPAYNLYSNERTLKSLELDNYSFANFFPIFIKQNNTIYDLSDVKIIRDAIIRYLDSVAYIAPIRVAPVLARAYQSDVETRYVQSDGENTRYILGNLSDKNNLQIIRDWLCDRFHLAKDLNIVKESGKRYRVVVTTNNDIDVDLVHMGFGLSQILPIITQGCISRSNSLMIVEDPDVHMHPSIQAAMADFFIFLCQERNVSVLVETHSDHFITRLRRRIAEKDIDANKVHLLFVLNEFGASEYKTIGLYDSGKLKGIMPPGFLDTRDTDFKAILEANRK